MQRRSWGDDTAATPAQPARTLPTAARRDLRVRDHYRQMPVEQLQAQLEDASGRLSATYRPGAHADEMDRYLLRLIRLIVQELAARARRALTALAAFVLAIVSAPALSQPFDSQRRRDASPPALGHQLLTLAPRAPGAGASA